jgi:putative PIN family toxin of toxin-antitoxin system
MRLVLDTDVIVAALRSPTGASAAILRDLDLGIGILLLSVPLALEYEAVCQRPEHRIVTGLSIMDVQSFVDTLIGLAEPVEKYFLWRPMLRDAGDEMVLETAVNGRADVLVTFNRRHYGDAPGIFGIEVLLPREALKRIRV